MNVDEEMKGKYGIIEGTKVSIKVLVYNTLWALYYGLTSLSVAIFITILI